MFDRARMRLITVALGGAVAAATFACGGGGSGSAPTASPGATDTAATTATPPASPEEALRLFVQRRLNQSFVEDCEDASRPEDVGKQCARFRGERNGLRAYELGPTFAEYTRLIILEPTADGWTIAHLENRDPGLPPVPGIPWPLENGAHVVVAGTAPDGLKVRDAPGLASTEIGRLNDGEEVIVVAGPVEQDDLEWWQLQDHGWAAGAYLRYPEEGPTPTPG